MSRILAEFREFAIKGNAMDLAVGVVIGGAFQRIVNSLVNDILMPPFAAVTGSVDMSSLFLPLTFGEWPKTLVEAKEKGVAVLSYGQFLNEVMSFILVAIGLFMIVKVLNRLRRETERRVHRGQPAVPSPVGTKKAA